MQFPIICLIFCFTAVNADFSNFTHGYPVMKMNTSGTLKSGTISVKVNQNTMWWFPQMFNLRYMYNDKFFNYSSPGPMFVFIGGEGPMEDTAGYLQSGLMYDMAKKMGAIMFMVEHRYYGGSIPNGNLKTANLGYLKIDQTMSDLKSFIKQMKTSMTSVVDSAVVLFGGSYAGNLALWMRLKNSDVVDAAVSVSAPVKLKVNIKDYLPILHSSLSDACNNAMKNGIQSILNKLTTNSGIQQIENDFNLCEPLHPNANIFKKEKGNLFWNILYPFANFVEYGTVESINATCASLLNSSDDSYWQLANFIKKFYGGKCIPSYSTTIGNLKIVGTRPYSARQWWYQMCAQLGLFVTTEGPKQTSPGVLPLSFYTGVCQDVFGMNYGGLMTSVAVQAANAMYGGSNPKVTYVVSVQGSSDPWSALGLSKTLNQFAPVINVANTTHCAVLKPECPSDPQSLKDARQQITNIIWSWIM